MFKNNICVVSIQNQIDRSLAYVFEDLWTDWRSGSLVAPEDLPEAARTLSREVAAMLDEDDPDMEAIKTRIRAVDTLLLAAKHEWYVIVFERFGEKDG